MELAHQLDSGENFDLVSKSNSGDTELVTESNSAENEKITNSEQQSDAPGGICPSTVSDRQVLLPSDRNFKIITKSNQEDEGEYEKITYSKREFNSEFETITNSPANSENSEIFEKVTKSIKTMNEAIELAKKILKHKKSARQTVAKLLSKLYSNTISFDDLK